MLPNQTKSTQQPTTTNIKEHKTLSNSTHQHPNRGFPTECQGPRGRTRLAFWVSRGSWKAISMEKSAFTEIFRSSETEVQPLPGNPAAREGVLELGTGCFGAYEESPFGDPM